MSGLLAGARPVHFNMWEATYFDLFKEKLHRLVDAAAQLGVERFILDDSWFKNRRSERAGLGDWWVDKTLFDREFFGQRHGIRSLAGAENG